MLFPTCIRGNKIMTKRELKSELQKAICGTAFKITSLITFLIVLWHLISIYGLMQQLPLESTPGRFTGKYNLFYWWLAIDCVSWPYVVFYSLFPFFACMPYAWSFMNDRNKKYDNQLMIRCGKRRYFFSKYLAVYISGGLVIAIPLAADLFGAALFSPASLPTVIFSMPGFSKGGFLTSLYYTQPWRFCFAFLIIEFLWGGTIAALSFVISLIYQAKIFGIIMPPFLLYVWDTLSVILKQGYTLKTGKYLEFSVMRLIHACTNSPNPVWLQLSIILALTIASGLATVVLAAKKDRI